MEECIAIVIMRFRNSRPDTDAIVVTRVSQFSHHILSFIWPFTFKLPIPKSINEYKKSSRYGSQIGDTSEMLIAWILLCTYVPRSLCYVVTLFSTKLETLIVPIYLVYV